VSRPEYPSDVERRKTRPHVRVHLTTRSHRKTAEVWSDPELRGMTVGLWQCASEAFAGKTGNRVHLDRTAVMWLTGRTQYAHAERALRALCARLEYPVSAHGALVVVEVRNFQQKQGYDSATRGAHSAPSAPSEDRGQRTEDRERAGTQECPQTRPSNGWMNVLGREPGTDAEKVAFLDTEMCRIEDEVLASLPPDRRDKKAVGAKTRSMILAWYRQRRKTDGARRPAGRYPGRQTVLEAAREIYADSGPGPAREP